MNFSEFRRILGAEPRSEDPAFLAARESSPEFSAEAEQAMVFEKKLEAAANIPVPEDLVDALAKISQTPPSTSEPRRRWAPFALAASLLVAVSAFTIAWQARNSWESVDEYLADHYRHDGQAVLEQAGRVEGSEVQAILADVGAEALPSLANIVGVIKYCPTPDGKGVHMVLNTAKGPVTLIYMPRTEVIDGAVVQFDEVEAVLVTLPHGSAALLGQGIHEDRELLALVHDSIISLPEQS